MAEHASRLQRDAVAAGQDHRRRGRQEYDVPLRKEWTVLDGLNHIKNEIDHDPVLPLVVPDGHLRQLRHERQRRTPADLRRRS